MNTPRTDEVSNQCHTDCHDAAMDAYQAMRQHAEMLEIEIELMHEDASGADIQNLASDVLVTPTHLLF